MNNNLNNNYSFDPMTGQSINQQQPVQNTTNMYTQQPVQPQQSFNTYQQPKKNNKVFIIIAIIAVIGIIAGIFLFSNQDNKEPINNEIPNNSNSSSDLNKEEYTGTKQNITIATVGQEGHGKTTLTSAITKLYGEYITAETISKGSEVSKNGVKFNSSFVEYESQTKHYYHYDLPGHNDYVKALISDAMKLDGAILVVSAVDGPKPQTRAQLKLLYQSGISKIIVYMSKCDLIDDKDILDMIEMQIRDLLNEYEFDGDNTPIIKGSALKAIEGDKEGEASIRDLINAMDKWFTKRTSSETSAPHTKFNAVVYVLTKDEGGITTPFINDYKPQISMSTSRESGTITLPLGIEMVMNGDNCDMTITLSKAISFKKGDTFQILEDGKIVGIGIVESIEK